MLQGYSACRRREEFLHGTWHAHLYSKPPAQPTPHFIEDILGLRSSKLDTPKTVDKQIQEETTVLDASSIRKSKQKAKYRSRGMKGVSNEKNRETTRSRIKTATPKTTKKEQVATKTKQSQSSKVAENQAEVKKKKKARTTFTGRQIWELENTFKEKKYLTSVERNELAELLNVTDCQVKIWFQNRRTKYKKLEVTPTNTEQENKEELRSTASSPSSPIASEDSAADTEVPAGKMTPDNVCKGQKSSLKKEKNNQENVDVRMNVDDRGV